MEYKPNVEHGYPYERTPLDRPIALAAEIPANMQPCESKHQEIRKKKGNTCNKNLKNERKERKVRKHIIYSNMKVKKKCPNNNIQEQNLERNGSMDKQKRDTRLG
jgi:hypothetical protein